jgi:hypothetical protein
MSQNPHDPPASAAYFLVTFAKTEAVEPKAWCHKSIFCVF